MKVAHHSPHKSKRVNAIREKYVRHGFEWAGYVFQVDAPSRTAIISRALKLSLSPNIQSVEWRCKDNHLVKFSREQFLEFAIAMDDYIEQLQMASWKQKDSLPHTHGD